VLSRVYERSSIDANDISPVGVIGPRRKSERHRNSRKIIDCLLPRLDRLIWNDSSSIRRMDDDVRTRSLSLPTCVVSLLFFSPFSSETERHRVKVRGLTVRSFVRYRVYVVAIRKVRRVLSNCITAARAFIRLCQKKAAESLSGKRSYAVGIQHVCAHTCAHDARSPCLLLFKRYK